MSGRRERRIRVQPGATGVLLVDLDHFKTVNDTHGHHSGDQVLCHVADLLQRCVRSGDSVVRWGGEEFLVLLAGSTTERTSQIAERILHAVRSEACRLASGVTLHLSCSIGWSELSSAEAPGSHATWESIVEHADRALYMAKAAGRDRARALLPRLEGPEERATAAHAHPEAEPGPRRIGMAG
jgi:diguanylate cyclase (GGDEF)-like protein